MVRMMDFGRVVKDLRVVWRHFRQVHCLGEVVLHPDRDVLPRDVDSSRYLLASQFCDREVEGVIRSGFPGFVAGSGDVQEGGGRI